MGVEHRRVTDAVGRVWTERWEAGEMIGREAWPMQAQSPKVRIELAMEEGWADWWRWHTTRVEAESRKVAAAVVTALRAREEAAWTNYAAAVNEWRQA